MCVYVSVWYVILEHEDKNVRAELIWRVLIATIKMPIHISQSKFSFHMQRSLKYTIREYGSTLYVGLASAVSPTNTNFRLTFLLTQLQEALYEDLAV